MISRLSPPFVWPETSDPDRAPRCGPNWTGIPETDAQVSLIAVMWGLDFLRREFPNLRLRLVPDGAREA